MVLIAVRASRTKANEREKDERGFAERQRERMLLVAAIGKLENRNTEAGRMQRRRRRRRRNGYWKDEERT